MQFRPARIALHLTAVTVLAGGAVLTTGGIGHADASARPDSYGGDATASAFHYVLDRVPQPTPVTDAFHAELPYATSSLDSAGGASASAAPFYPGAGPLGVPALLCQFAAQLCTALPQPVPRYPFMATASYPTTPNDTADYSVVPAQSGGGMTFSPAVAQAHAKQDQVESLTKATGLSMPGNVSADSAMTHSLQRFEGNTLVVTAETTVQGLDLGGGQLHIDLLRSTAVARVDGGKITTSAASTTITGASAGGHAVTIDSHGIQVPGGGDGGAAQSQVNSALANLKSQGIDIRMLGSTKQVKDGAASAVSGGLLVTFNKEEEGLPKPPPLPQPPPVCIPQATCLPGAGAPDLNGTYFGSVTIGGAGVDAFATPAMNWDFFPFTAPGNVVPPTTQLAQVPSAAAPVVSPALPSTVQQNNQPPTVSLPTTPHNAAVLGLDLTNRRLRLLTLVLLGYPLLVLLTSPVRRSRVRSAT